MGKVNYRSDIEQMDRHLEKERRRQEIRKIPKPTILKRFGCILIDLLLFFVIFVGFEFIMINTYLKANNYEERITQVQNYYKESHLFIKTNDSQNESIYNVYDDSKTPEENYDIPITYYYSHDARAIKDKKLEQYQNSKIESGYYVYENEEIVRTTLATDENVKAFLEAQYKSAELYFHNDPLYLENTWVTHQTMTTSYLFSATLASLVIYLLVPLLRREGETIGQIVGKICLVDSKTYKNVTKRQVIIRYVVLYIFNIFFPLSMFVIVGDLTLIPLFITALMITYTRSNSGLHDYLSKTIVIRKDRQDFFETLKMLKGGN